MSSAKDGGVWAWSPRSRDCASSLRRKRFHRKAQAIKDSDARLRQRLATAVFAVCYPDGVTEDNLAESTLTWTLRVKPGEPADE